MLGEINKTQKNTRYMITLKETFFNVYEYSAC